MIARWTVNTTCRQDEKNGKTDQENEKKSLNRDILSPRGGAFLQPIFTKFGVFVDLTEKVKLAKFSYK